MYYGKRMLMGAGLTNTEPTNGQMTTVVENNPAPSTSVNPFAGMTGAQIAVRVIGGLLSIGVGVAVVATGVWLGTPKRR